MWAAAGVKITSPRTWKHGQHKCHLCTPKDGSGELTLQETDLTAQYVF